MPPLVVMGNIGNFWTLLSTLGDFWDTLYLYYLFAIDLLLSEALFYFYYALDQAHKQPLCDKLNHGH